jgi:hypothetical protein
MGHSPALSGTFFLVDQPEPIHKREKQMTKQEELTVLGTLFSIILLMWMPVFIDLYRQEKKLNKRKGSK